MEVKKTSVVVSPPGTRLEFLDWTRGLAAVIMLQGHVFHSFTRPDLRAGDAYVLSQFVGGMPPAIFLFLTGVTLAFLMDKCERRGMGALERMSAALRRAGYLALLAILFRLQMFVFGLPQNDYAQLLRVDILNCMGFGMAVVAVMTLFTTAERVRLSAGLGLAVAGLSPLVTLLGENRLPPYVAHYIVPHAEAFSFFPWGAFLAFGLSAGSLLRLAPRAELPRVMQWGAWLGIVLVIAAQYFANLPYSIYPKSDFWLNSPALVFIKLGIILVLLAFAYLWMAHAVTGFSWVRQLGTTSLLVYWVHTELVYGRWLWFWKESLGTLPVVLLSIAVIALMVGLSVARTRWRDWNWRGAFLLPAQPKRASGD